MTLLSNAGSTLIIQPNSQIRYQFTPKFQPQAAFGSNRQQTWALFHPSGTAIPGWQISGGNSFAYIEFSRNMALSGDLGTSTSTEKSKLDLNQPQQP